jgi:hypothetical protein
LVGGAGHVVLLSLVVGEARASPSLLRRRRSRSIGGESALESSVSCQNNTRAYPLYLRRVAAARSTDFRGDFLCSPEQTPRDCILSGVEPVEYEPV